MNASHLNDLSSLSDVTLWTGGWDSTYRVLQRAMLDETATRPCYVVDRDRQSTGKEVDTMNGLLKWLTGHRPEVYARIEPPRYVALQAIPPHAEITEAWRHLRDAYDIGSQYDWLARLAEAGDWTGVELSVYGGGRLRPMFGDHIQRVEQAGGRTTWSLGPDAPEPQRLLFGRFAFPLWETSKLEAVAQADREGLTEILRRQHVVLLQPHQRQAMRDLPALPLRGEGRARGPAPPQRAPALRRPTCTRHRWTAGPPQASPPLELEVPPPHHL